MEQVPEKLQPLLLEYSQKFFTLRPAQEYSGSLGLVNDYKNLKQGEGDGFFARYGVGNNVQTDDRPFERARAYELLLQILQEYDTEKYLSIHKGTPYYFIGWTALQFLDFEKALFYMDAAVSEDLRFPDVRNQQRTTPALDFFLLNVQTNATGSSAHFQMDMIVSKTREAFNSRSSLDLQKPDFVDKFVKPLLYGDKKKRSVITALYGFFLEFEKRKSEIQLKSSEGGSAEPFLNHLFKGARILESLLEIAGGTGQALRPKIKSLPQLSVDNKCLKSNQTLADAEAVFSQMRSRGSNFQDCNFAASFIIRNTTGHSLLWPDQFTTESSYTILYDCLVNSILWSIYKLWCSNVN